LKKIINFLLFLLLVTVFLPGQSGWAADEKRSLTKSDPWVYTITHRTTVHNPDAESIYNIQVIIPLMHDKQPEFQDFMGEELSPWPVKIIENEKGARAKDFLIGRGNFPGFFITVLH
jgi:hypothetical protein